MSRPNKTPTANQKTSEASPLRDTAVIVIVGGLSLSAHLVSHLHDFLPVLKLVGVSSIVMPNL